MATEATTAAAREVLVGGDPSGSFGRPVRTLADGAASYLRATARDLFVRPPGQLPPLDGLRGLAILAVIAGHYLSRGWTLGGGAPVEQLFTGALGSTLAALLETGWVGVDLFFVLSGFLIGGQLWRELAQTGTVRVGRFILRRGFRIWPLYAFALIAPGLVADGEFTFHWADWLFASNYVKGGLAGGWSLSTEEQFYIAIPLLLSGFAAAARLRRTPLRAAHWLGLLAVLIAAVEIVRALTVARLRGAGMTDGAIAQAIHFPIHLHCEGLLVGLALALVAHRRPARFRQVSLGPGAGAGAGGAARRVSWSGVAVASAMVALGLALRSFDQRVFSFLALGLAFGGVTLWALWDRSLLSAPLGARATYPIARLSYGMYLNHFFVLELVVAPTIVPPIRAALGDTPLAFAAAFVVAVCGSIIVAAVTFAIVERPFLRWRAWLDARAAAAVAGQPTGLGPDGVTPRFGRRRRLQRAA